MPRLDQWGVMTPAPAPLMVARNLFIRMYPRMAEILHLLGSSSLMAIPTEADLHGPLAARSTAIWIRLQPPPRSASGCFAWPGIPAVAPLPRGRCCTSATSGATRCANALILYNFYDREPMTTWVRQFLEQE